MCGIKQTNKQQQQNHKKNPQASEDKLHGELWFMLQHRLELVLSKKSSGSSEQLRMNLNMPAILMAGANPQ